MHSTGHEAKPRNHTRTTKQYTCHAIEAASRPEPTKPPTQTEPLQVRGRQPPACKMVRLLVCPYEELILNSQINVWLLVYP